MRGYYEIGILNNKHEVNVGTLWRAAYQLGASGIFTIGNRYKKQASDTTKSYRHIPLRNYIDWGVFISAIPHSAVLVGVEIGGVPLRDFAHPERALYLLGAEDSGLGRAQLNDCDAVVEIEHVRTPSYNVAVAGALIMYDRLSKSLRAGAGG